MFKRIYRELKNYFLKAKFKYFGSNIHFFKNVYVDKSCSFEGYNSIGYNSVISCCTLGKGTYIGRDVNLNKVKFGRFCSIASRINNTTGNHPTSVFVSTHPAFFSKGLAAGFTFTEESKFRELNYVEDNYLVKVGNDVWIGDNVTIKDGVSIGDGAIIGANSLILKDIEPYSINVGTPSRIIGYRFEKEDIEFLLNFKWWDRDFNWLRENTHLFEDIKFLKKYYDEENS